VTDLLGTAAELVEQGYSMQEPEFYDAAMTGDGEPAMLPLRHSPWRPVYEEAARWIPSSAPVLDLGCGTGRFLAHLAQTSHHAALAGVDFAPAAVAEARNYVRSVFEDEMDFYHRCSIDVADLREWQPQPGTERTTFVCLEVLEHLVDDLGLVRRIPPGAQLVFSVPSYMSASHVRCFRTIESVFEHFGPYLDIRRWAKFEFGAGNVIHICDSTRRAGAW
jgi:trans-aconitate methyltransferase